MRPLDTVQPGQNHAKKFSEVQDALDLDLMVPNPNKRRGSDDPDYIKVKMCDASPDQRPGFHQIRGLAMRLVAEAGVDPQSLIPKQIDQNLHR